MIKIEPQIDFLLTTVKKRLLTFIRALLKKQNSSNELKDEIDPANNR